MAGRQLRGVRRVDDAGQRRADRHGPAGASSAPTWLFTEVLPASQWALHSCGCSGSMLAGMPSQSGMAAIAAATSAGAGASCGHAYDAVASWVNSSTTMSQPDTRGCHTR
jgi:hypothetical protein